MGLKFHVHLRCRVYSRHLDFTRRKSGAAVIAAGIAVRVFDSADRFFTQRRLAKNRQCAVVWYFSYLTLLIAFHWSYKSDHLLFDSPTLLQIASNEPSALLFLSVDGDGEKRDGNDQFERSFASVRGDRTRSSK